MLVGLVTESTWPETVSHQVQEVIERYRRYPAVKDSSGRTLTYAKLDKRINAISAKLLTVGVTPESRVGVFQEPGIDWVASVLAILRVGAVYVPLDLRTPTSRLATIINDSQSVAILAHSATLDEARTLSSGWSKTINVTLLSGTDKVVHSDAAQADLPAALLYTSGTTGAPKGIILRHRGLRNEVEFSSKTFEIGPESRILQQSAFSFDISLWQTLLALTTGACLVIASRQQRGDPTALSDLIVSEKLTTTISTPSEYVSWLQYGNSELLRQSRWSIAVSCGEKFTPTLMNEFKTLQKKDLRVFNSYGPCEVTFSSHEIEIDYTQNHETIPTGMTIANASVYIMDEGLNALPVGIPGEIVISGVGVAAGYLDNKEQNKTHFLPDIFASPEFISKGWVTMYRSGDRGRLREDGALIVEGRIAGDTQVKIRGVRMELQDIEKNIVQSSGGNVIDAVVSLRGDPQFLVAHAVFSKDRTPLNQEGYLQKLLADLPLPQYMCPAMIIPLEKLPVTKHFKIDRVAVSALPFPEVSQWGQRGSNFTEPQQRMKAVWEEIITKDVAQYHHIDEHSDFFHVGGNSMLLVQLQAEIKKVFGAFLPLVQLFQTSTLGKMTAKIVSKMDGEKAKIDWEKETAISMDHLTVTDLTQKEAIAVPKIVALTGSTGFLGRTLLRQLIEDPSISQIHCISVRKNPSRPLPALLSSPKVFIHDGDLRRPNLGLSNTSLNQIFNTVDAVIHNGADVSFMKTYHSLESVNVGSTKELARLSLPRRIPFHYISTAGVAHLSGLSAFPEVSAASYMPPTDGSDGYTASKWASEVYLERLSKASGLPVWIHRPSSIMGEEPAETDLMANLLRYTLMMRAVPVLRASSKGKQAITEGGNEGGYIDLVDVENVAQGVLKHVKSAGADDTAMGPLVKYTYHSGEMIIPMSALGVTPDDANATATDENQGLPAFQALSLPDWTAKAKSEGLNDLLAEFLNAAQDGLNDASEGMGDLLVYPRLVKGLVV